MSDGAERGTSERPSERSSPVSDGAERALFVVKGEATPEEIAALTVVLQATAAAPAAVPRPPRPEWSAPHRLVRRPHQAGPGGWRSSSLPR